MRARIDRPGMYLRNLDVSVKVASQNVSETQGGNIERILEAVLKQIVLEGKLGEYYLRAELTRIQEVNEAMHDEFYSER